MRFFKLYDLMAPLSIPALETNRTLASGSKGCAQGQPASPGGELGGALTEYIEREMIGWTVVILLAVSD